MSVHSRHCCKNGHSCKYGEDEDCPVVLANEKGEHECDLCKPHTFQPYREPKPMIDPKLVVYNLLVLAIPGITRGPASKKWTDAVSKAIEFLGETPEIDPLDLMRQLNRIMDMDS